MRQLSGAVSVRHSSLQLIDAHLRNNDYNLLSLFVCSEVTLNHTKVTLPDTIYPPSECIASIPAKSWLVLALATLFWLFRSIKTIFNGIQYWDIKKFYNTALKINDVSAILKIVLERI